MLKKIFKKSRFYLHWTSTSFLKSLNHQVSSPGKAAVLFPLAKNGGGDTSATSMKMKVKHAQAWVGTPDEHSDSSSSCPCLSFLKWPGTAPRLQWAVESAKMEQLMPPSTLPFNWIFSTCECADSFHPALVIWESTAGKLEIRSSTLLEILLKVFHIL